MRKIAKPITKMAIFIAVFLSIGLFSLSADAVDINQVDIVIEEVLRDDIEEGSYVWKAGEVINVYIKSKWHWRWRYRKYNYYGFSAEQNGVDVTSDVTMSNFRRIRPYWRSGDGRYSLEFQLKHTNSGTDDIDLTIWVKNWSKTSKTFTLKIQESSSLKTKEPIDLSARLLDLTGSEEITSLTSGRISELAFRFKARAFDIRQNFPDFTAKASGSYWEITITQGIVDVTDKVYFYKAVKYLGPTPDLILRHYVFIEYFKEAPIEDPNVLTIDPADGDIDITIEITDKDENTHAVSIDNIMLN